MTAPWSIRPEQRILGGRRARNGSFGYAQSGSAKGRIRLRWRWRDETSWRAGSTHSADEAAAWLDAARDALMRGEEPPPFPEYEPPVVEARVPQKIDFDSLERCEVCTLLKPCDPCIPALRRELLSARREA